MANREIQKMDLVPSWIRHTVAEGQVKEPPRAHGFQVVDPYAPESADKTPVIRRIKAELYQDPESGTGVVNLAWEGTTPPVYEFYKKYSSAKDAELVYSSLLKELRQVESYVEADPAMAKEKVKELFEEYKGKSDVMSPETPEIGTRTNTSLHQEISKGWEVLNKQGRLLVAFSDEFLGELFTQHKQASSEPIQPGEFTYTTTTRPHCGLDNFVVSYWRKVKTADGNIVRNAALVSRIGGKSFFVTNVSMEDFSVICSSLTPDPVKYGISYDSVTNRWYKTAAVVERYFSDPNHPDELDKILDYLGKGKKKKEELPLLKEEPKMEGPEKEPKEKAESLPLGPEEETLPLGEKTEEEGKGSPEAELEKLLQKEATDKSEK